MDSFDLVATLAKIGFVLIIILTFAPLLIWAERRQSAMMQDRIGPVRAGFNIPLPGGKTFNLTLFGLLHPLADAVKFIWKEDFVPPKADKLLHALAPIIALIPAVCVFAVIPFGDAYYPALADQVLTPENIVGARKTLLQVASLNVGMLYIFGVAGTGIVGAAIAGYCSDNKFSLLGGLRAASQMVSYEVMLGLSLVGCFMVYGTLQLGEMVHWQQQNCWGVFAQPFAFFLYITASIAETKRIPFDVPEGESEIVAGYFTEYSGMKFGMFFMAEFIEVVTGSALIITFFLGGWLLPGLHPDGFHVPFSSLVLTMPHWAVTALSVIVFVTKLVAVIFMQLQIRWSLPRFRYDQIMKLCWKILLPASLANVLVTGVLVLIDETFHTELFGREMRLAVFPGYFLISIAVVAIMFAISKRPRAIAPTLSSATPAE